MTTTKRKFKEKDDNNVLFIDRMRKKFTSVFDHRLMIPKEERITLAWKNIVYCKSISKKKGCKQVSKDKKYILNKVSGIARPGRLVVCRRHVLHLKNLINNKQGYHWTLGCWKNVTIKCFG